MKAFSFLLIFVAILLPEVSFAQNVPSASFVALKNEVSAYQQKSLQSVFEQQRKKLNSLIAKEDKAAIYTLSRQFEAHQTQKKQLFDQKQTDGAVFMQTWEALQQKEVEILIKIEDFVEKYEAAIHQVLKTDIQAQIKKWQLEMNQILAKYNAPLQYPQQRYFAKYGFGKWSSPAYFLLWNAEKPANQEAAAETGN